jgi:hypothetical protein
MSTEKRRISEIDAVKAELKARGWTRNGYYEEASGKVCLVGAISKAYRDGGVGWLANKRVGPDRVVRLAARIEKFLGLPGRPSFYSCLEAWNDSQKSVEDVLAMLDKFEEWESENEQLSRLEASAAELVDCAKGIEQSLVRAMRRASVNVEREMAEQT